MIEWARQEQAKEPPINDEFCRLLYAMDAKAFARIEAKYIKQLEKNRREAEQFTEELSEHCRQIKNTAAARAVMLRYAEGLSAFQIGQKMGYTEATIQSYLSKAFKTKNL